MSACILRYLLVAIAGLLLAGCDQKALLQKFVPKDDDAFARRFLDAVRTGNYTTADQMLDSSLRSESLYLPLVALHGSFLASNDGDAALR